MMIRGPIGSERQNGNWQVVHHRDVGPIQIGNYPDRASTVAYACRLTAKEYGRIRVLSGSGPDDREYFVENGRVIKIAKREPDRK